MFFQCVFLVQRQLRRNYDIIYSAEDVEITGASNANSTLLVRPVQPAK